MFQARLPRHPCLISASVGLLRLGMTRIATVCPQCHRRTRSMLHRQLHNSCFTCF